MFQIEWTFEPGAKEITGFSLGDLTLRGKLGQVTSKGRIPDQACMIFASMPYALNGVREFLTHPKMHEFRYRGIGCNFGFEVQRPKGPRGPIRVTAMGEPIEDVDPKTLAGALAAGVAACLRRHRLEPDDAALEDLLDAQIDFQAMRESLGLAE